MNPIRDFFKRRTTEKRFKTAGPGHKLNETSSKNSKCDGNFQQTASPRPSPQQFSEEARHAGAAALARIEQKQQSSINWSAQAIKAQAKKELEEEKSPKLTQSIAPKKVIQEDCSSLTVSGVYFKCPIIGPEVASKEEIEDKIKIFLYEQLQQERGLTACLIIHTLNKNKDKVHIGIETLVRYITNILDNPVEDKYRKIRLKNKVFQERVLGLEGAFDFLIAAGFCKQMIEVGGVEEEYFVYPEENLVNLENLQMLKEAILSAEPIIPVLDRNLRVLRPSQATAKINLPNDFFNLSAEEIKREQEAKAEAVEVMTQLRTKAMRERDETKDFRVYKFTLIRIRFPDGIILQGTFYVHEKLSAVKEFVVDNLADPEKSFQLLFPGGSKLTDDDNSLLSLKLVPAVILNFLWSNNLPDENTCYLKSDTMSLLTDL